MAALPPLRLTSVKREQQADSAMRRCDFHSRKVYLDSDCAGDAPQSSSALLVTRHIVRKIDLLEVGLPEFMAGADSAVGTSSINTWRDGAAGLPGAHKHSRSWVRRKTDPGQSASTEFSCRRLMRRHWGSCLAPRIDRAAGRGLGVQSAC